MSRWEPNATERLVGAAIEAFEERGFEQTTVAEIARRAGVTERTFYRHFSDKREVLFFGSPGLQSAFTEALAAAPAEDSPLDAVMRAFFRAAGFFSPERRPYSRRRQAVIDANPELQERERQKLASIAQAVAEVLVRERGIGAPTATLVSEVGIALFKTAFERWLNDPQARGYEEHARAALTELKTVAGS